MVPRDVVGGVVVARWLDCEVLGQLGRLTHTTTAPRYFAPINATSQLLITTCYSAARLTVGQYAGGEPGPPR